MTPAEQIAYLRRETHGRDVVAVRSITLLAVCDLAERALLDDDEVEAVRRVEDNDDERHGDRTIALAVLRRLLGE